MLVNFLHLAKVMWRFQKALKKPRKSPKGQFMIKTTTCICYPFFFTHHCVFMLVPVCLVSCDCGIWFRSLSLVLSVRQLCFTVILTRTSANKKKSHILSILCVCVCVFAVQQRKTDRGRFISAA